MKITLAQALKEKNRIAGEITRLRKLVYMENSHCDANKRSISVEQTMEKIELYKQKLIELKTSIGKANAGILENIYTLEELKSELNWLSELDTRESVDQHYLSALGIYGYENQQTSVIIKRTAVITASDVIEKTEELQFKCNRLQDEINRYNVSEMIEFDTPLK